MSNASKEEQFKLPRPSITRVGSIIEALKLAQELKADGTYDCFRGQVNSKWRVSSSAERAGSASFDESKATFNRFYGWASICPEMAAYRNNEDALWAIAQHYGLRTLFIDFTTDPLVAGFFASDTSTPQEASQEAAIICLNSKDFIHTLKEFSRCMPSKYPVIPEFICIDVDNLWRLNAQNGLFLWNPYMSIEDTYHFDRIVFPYTKDDPLIPRKDEIYPLNQSKLEQLLTRFFMNEMMRRGSQNLENIEGLEIFRFDSNDHSYEASSWSYIPVEKSVDWLNSGDWLLHVVEAAPDALTGARIPFDHNSMIEGIRLIEDLFTIEYIESNRGKGLFFDETNLKTPGGQGYLTCIRHLWNGMQRLPFTSNEIKKALDETSRQYLLKVNDPDTYNPSRGFLKPFGDDTLEIEMASNKDGSGDYSRSYVTRTGVLKAMNPIFTDAVCAALKIDKLVPSLVERSLQLGARPSQRFTFSGLRSLFVDEMIPSQLVWRGLEGNAGLNITMYFSPSEINVFGLP